MHIKVLGSAAGGGFPQWNCNGANSRDVRDGVPGLTPRTQSSIAVSADGHQWVLFNASPDLRQQINNTRELQPQPGDRVRSSPIKAVVVTNADVDHISGLLNLREGQPFNLYAADRVLETIDSNSIFNVLNRDLVARVPMKFDEPFPVKGADGETGLTVEAFAVPGKIALFLEDGSKDNNFGSKDGDTIGLKISDEKSGSHFFYIPGCAEVDEPLAARLKDAPLVLFDGTLYTNEEMIEQGLMPKTGERMGHMNISGPNGTIAAFEPLNVKRRILIHINNSNPVLRENSEERAAVERAGWEVSFDGMEVTL